MIDVALAAGEISWPVLMIRANSMGKQLFENKLCRAAAIRVIAL
jgi:hypothetical protein